ncbi:cytochrome P460 family protein [Cocleimonas sp. KMM 6892]|uniref:cytochrome P460 family protein n=1 Tax=unclassified Cocleimonas TaxID=2639732 RepID=UPI002DB869AD|nr:MULTISPECIES: cytochrome P460 family protein [unclassified Cocleimonas]MEB8433056.1 cytochrome P460 family protein [Cocleimonas sp. KMM 6892]MEC4715963.1 cytochrome P460 family protein [Cocleimonas sp. KMM 6895]MEC4745424.1 cytochrome P460 family protein [Cocleimonas sp. KMM 6896]
MKPGNIKKTTITKTLAITTIAALSAITIGCSTGMHKNKTMTAKNDGDIIVPANYRSWPKFVGTVDKMKTGQVREIYINKTGMKTQKGNAFPDGTVSIMEIYGAQKSPTGELLKDSKGKLIKGKLSKVFVMEKGAGWGSKQAKGTINNGDWLYGAYLADAKTPATKDFTSCRSCHAPLADKDYIFRYDEHFDTSMH